MDAATEMGYKPPPEFKEDAKDSLIELNLTDSTELWLIQWPINQPPDFDGQEVSLKLHHDGQLGSFEGSSGKSYDMVSFSAQYPDATVFLSSASDSKVVGKISRRVSLVHYPEPSELPKQNTSNLKQMYQRSSGATTLTSSARHLATSTQNIRPRNSQSASGNAASTQRKSCVSDEGEPTKPPKRRRVDDSVVRSSGSLEHSLEMKSKKKGRN